MPRTRQPRVCEECQQSFRPKDTSSRAKYCSRTCRRKENLDYSREQLEPLVRASVSVSEVLKKLGRDQYTGSMHGYLTKAIKRLELDTSHFHGKTANRGNRHKGGPGKTPWQVVLTKRVGFARLTAGRLRRALHESGRPDRCEGPKCEVVGEWLGRRITLEVNHKNGDWLDNRPENLELLCPNCHSQTETYGRRPSKRECDGTR